MQCNEMYSCGQQDYYATPTPIAHHTPHTTHHAPSVAYTGTTTTPASARQHVEHRTKFLMSECEEKIEKDMA